MRLFRFDAGVGREITHYGSRFRLSPLTDPEGRARAVCFHLEPGGVVGRHRAVSHQLLCVVAGEGWVSGEDGERVAISAWEAAYWREGEEHETGTGTGLTAIVLEGEFSPWATPRD